MTSALETSKPATITSQRSSFATITLLGVLALLWFVVCRHLSAEWSYNEQYNYGWFVPFFALYLFWLRWEDRPQPLAAAGGPKSKLQAPIGIAIAVGALLVLLPLRAIEVANPDWRPISWLHALIAVAVTLILLGQMGGSSWIRHFVFPVAFVLISVPWPSAIEGPVIQGLMPTVASIAVETLSLLGIPAEVQGNLIRIGDGMVGVNEACSGVRSLQTSIMIGLLFGELKRMSILRRAALILCAVAIAFIANCGRAIFLVWIAAAKGVEQVEHWHDFAGYAIVVLVFVGCLGLTKWLGRSSPDPAKVASVQTMIHVPSAGIIAVALMWLIAVEISVETWYRLHERNLVASAQWSVQWPEAAQQFRELKIDDRTKGLLHYDTGRGAMWRQTEPTETGGPLFTPTILYFFRWYPGHNSALLANSHRPDVCLPATGWQQVADLGVRNYEVNGAGAIPFRHFRFENRAGDRSHFADAFYCVWEDRVRADAPLQSISETPSAWTRSERIQAVLDGKRHLGQQVMEYLQIRPVPVDSAEVEQRFADDVKTLVRPAGTNGKAGG